VRTLHGFGHRKCRADGHVDTPVLQWQEVGNFEEQCNEEQPELDPSKADTAVPGRWSRGHSCVALERGG
jgi:hypothetical protein